MDDRGYVFGQSSVYESIHSFLDTAAYLANGLLKDKDRDMR